MLPVIAKSVYKNNNNADAATKFAEWAATAPFDQVVEAYADCHRDPNIDDTFIRTLGQLDRYYLGVFLCNRHGPSGCFAECTQAPLPGGQKPQF